MDRLTTSFRQHIFLLDGAGALISGILLLCLIAPHPEWFGMPAQMARGLALPAFLLAGFGLGATLSRIAETKTALRWLAISNSFYCIATIIVLLLQRHQMTGIGIAYFIGELCIIGALIRIEWLASRRNG